MSEINKPTFRKTEIKLMCFCATACTGKTTYMKAIAGLPGGKLLHPSEYGAMDRPVTLSMGNFFRQTFGSKFFQDRQRPCAPEVTNNFVKSMMTHSMDIAYNHGKDMITDGFPRSSLQLEWLLNSSFASKRPILVELRFLYADESELVRRQEERLQSCVNDEDREFLSQRIRSDKASFISVLECAQRLVRMGNYPNLSMKEINV